MQGSELHHGRDTWAGKPSRRIVFRKLTLNLRFIIAISVLVFEFLSEVVTAFTNEDSILDFIISVAGSTNLIILAITIGLFLLFFYMVALVVTNIGAIIWGYLNYITMDNYIDQDAIYIKKGVLFKKEFQVPMNKLTNVETNISILDRVLRTADVHISTAGGADIYILETLDQSDARQISAFLRKQINRIDTQLDAIPQDFLSDPRIEQELKEIRELLMQTSLTK